jgi:LacI family transcriptional regulator
VARMRVGLRDVAERAGVSVGAVSHYLNHPERVAAATAERIGEAVDALGYVPNIAGRHLRQGVSDVIGFVAPDLSNPHFLELSSSIEDVAQERGIRVFIANSRGVTERENAYLSLFEEYKVRGIVIASHQPIEHRLAGLRRRGTPTVLVGQRAEAPEQMWVSTDNIRGGELIGRHLVETGRRRVVFVGGPADVPQVADRLAGLRRALDGTATSLEVVSVDDRTVEVGGEVATSILSRSQHDRPDAVACANDLLALGFLRTAIGRGAGVPDDLAITGYDDTVFAEASLVPLTSVGQDSPAVARRAVAALLDGVRDAAFGQLTEPRLVVRQSSAPS